MQPGKIAEQLIQYIGGLQGGRLFKVEGLRNLLSEHQPHQAFTRSGAVQCIGIVKDGKPTGIEKHQDIYLAPRQRGGKLTAENVFESLLSKKLVRAGLQFKCPRCDLEFWRSIDELGSTARCEYCEDEFNVLPQLKDRDWKYRRSGLLGDYNHQEGAIPVILTLQQLTGVVSHLWSPLFTTAHSLRLASDATFKCETDFVFICKGRVDEPLEIVIGECKTHHAIEEARRGELGQGR